MNDSLGTSFERNQYFSGKLLTAQDFKAEQRYINDKRRLINRLIFGSGIICGLQVIPVNEKIISIETGMAMDYVGREIIVDSTITQNISKLSGFPVGEFCGDLFLCIEYDETLKEKVFSVEKSENSDNYNRVLEGFTLSIRKDAPDRSKNSINSLVESIQNIYSDKNIRIWIKTPKYIASKEIFEAELIIEKSFQTKQVSVDFELLLDKLEAVELNNNKFEFIEPLNSNETEYHVKIKLQAFDKEFKKASIKIKDSKLNLKLGGDVIDVLASNTSYIKIIDGPVNNAIEKDYFDLDLNKLLELKSDNLIYLAKISVMQVVSQIGSAFSIEKIENLEYTNKVYNIQYLNSLRKNSFNNISHINESDKKIAFQEAAATSNIKADSGSIDENPVSRQTSTNEIAKSLDVNSGTIEIRLESESKYDKSFCSEEIEHGLGAGNVFIMTGIEEKSSNVVTELTNNDEQIFFGNLDVFNKTAFASSLPSVSMGSIVYPKKGTFRVGLTLNSSTKLSKITVKWWAYKKLDSQVSNNTTQGKINVNIDSDIAEMKTGSSYQFKINVTGTDNKSVNWSVNEPNGGSISSEGIYTAPWKKGVYSITAVSSADTQRNATVYIIVKE